MTKNNEEMMRRFFEEDSDFVYAVSNRQKRVENFSGQRTAENSGDGCLLLTYLTHQTESRLKSE